MAEATSPLLIMLRKIKSLLRDLLIRLDIMEVESALVNNFTNMSNQPLSPTARRTGNKMTRAKKADSLSPGGSSSLNERLKSPNAHNKRRVRADSGASD